MLNYLRDKLRTWLGIADLDTELTRLDGEVGRFGNDIIDLEKIKYHIEDIARVGEKVGELFPQLETIHTLREELEIAPVTDEALEEELSSVRAQLNTVRSSQTFGTKEKRMKIRMANALSDRLETLAKEKLRRTANAGN